MSYDLQRKTPLSMFSVGTTASEGVLFRYAIEDLHLSDKKSNQMASAEAML
jgi:hypothetical protein